MRNVAMVLVLVTGSGTAFAQETPLTCWYDENGTYTGADSGNHGNADTQVGQAAKVGESGDYTWAYIIGEWEDGSSCPAAIPADVLAAAGG